ncbi:MAG: hypothetical protein AAFN07_15825 [Pseudomonadota bacterium]
MKWAILAAAIAFVVFSSWKKPRLTSSILWSLTATVASTSALILALPTDLKETLLWMSVATPFIWMLFIFWCHWDARPMRPTIALVSITVIGAVVVLQLPAPTGG